MPEKDTESNNMPWKVTAILTLITTLGTAVLANWDKLNAKKPDMSQINKQSETAPSQHSQNISPPTLPSSSISSSVSIPEKTYYVIAGSSEYRDNLKSEPKRAAGNEYYHSFPNIKICASKTEGNKYYLVVGSELSKSDAEALKQQAINNNFRSDTYISPSNEIPFTRTSCQSIDIKT
ncbi:MAG: hypothetical protein Fur0025_48480 [Oscillatoriaceae cyanobacterium]